MFRRLGGRAGLKTTCNINHDTESEDKCHEHFKAQGLGKGFLQVLTAVPVNSQVGETSKVVRVGRLDRVHRVHGVRNHRVHRGFSDGGCAELEHLMGNKTGAPRCV